MIHGETGEERIDVVSIFPDYLAPLDLPRAVHAGPIAAFFPGSTIGNFEPAEAIALLCRFRRLLGADAVHAAVAANQVHDLVAVFTQRLGGADTERGNAGDDVFQLTSEDASGTTFVYGGGGNLHLVRRARAIPASTRRSKPTRLSVRGRRLS